ncbi:beta-ketoacyl synthase chain length factor [Luteibacter flocculans]|uniref:Beta-ketoacyl synthase chain length factor n=1 Tax=Luteibacter flocculans TaxID=2780091 RepID=A0ABY4T356_9GAMM|nr:beta-ketoacyl synthase chain length factor [Luteibacter flocculans]URL58342.1 beta-ketoacyl synthase chain length factor [Luteibacter flocculans]
MSAALSVWVSGIGLWAPGASTWDAFRDVVSGGAPSGASERPVADVLPPNERRRAPESVLLAAAAAGQAVRMSGRDAATLPCVFASAHGDQVITDYMCQTLATAPLELSPTKFHNSVHNAPAGYWTIATHCHASSSAVSGGEQAFGAGLLEAASLAVADDRDVLLASYDIAGSGPLGAMTSTTGPFAVAMVLSPRAGGAATRLDITPERGNVGAEPIGDPWLDGLVASNPAAHSVPLMHALALMRPTALRVPAARGLDLHIDIGVAA